MTLHNPVWLHADSYDAVDFRQAISSLLNPAGGIVGSGDYAVTAPSSGMSVNVAGGQIWIPGTAVANQAQYYMFNDATISVTVPAADATNPRIDLIVAQVLDATAGAASSIGQVIDVAGTPAASPVAPATPASSIVLAQVAVAAGVTSIVAGNITDERPFFYVTLVNQPAARLYNSANSEVAAGTNAQISNMTADFIQGGVTITNNGLVVPVAGIYAVTAQIVYQNGSDSTVPSGQYNCNVFKNGALILGTQIEVGATNSFATPFTASSISLAAGDAIELWGYTSSAQNAYTYPGSTRTWLSVSKVG